MNIRKNQRAFLRQVSANMLIINMHSLAQLGSVFTTFGRVHGVAELDEDLSNDELLEIIQKTKAEPFFYELAELIIYHRATSDCIIEYIFKYADNNRELLYSLSNFQGCSVDILQKLSISSYKSISEHAKINLLKKSIHLLNNDEVVQLLKAHNNDNYYDIGVKHVIASSDSVASEILEKLSIDADDNIAAQAKINLSRRK